MPNHPAGAEAPFLSKSVFFECCKEKGSALSRGLFLYSGKGISFSRYFLVILLLLLLFAGYPENTLAAPKNSSCTQRSIQSLAAEYIEGHSRPPQSFLSSWEIGRVLVRSSRETGLPLYLLLAIAQQESSFNPHAINGASQDYGLFQVHYPFWRMFFRKRVGKNLESLRPEDLMKVSINTKVAIMILSYDLKLSRGDMVEMLGRYSGRTGRAHKEYVADILSHSMAFVRYEGSIPPGCREKEGSLN